jgi:uncharacterized membrane protein (UPF0127 family)
VRRRLIILALVVVAGGIAFWLLLQGANRPADPYFRGPVKGFGRQSFSIERLFVGRRTGSRFCALLAVTDDQLSRGLMGRRNLAGYDAMLFRFGDEANRPFTMRGTLIPISIAWFDGRGAFVDGTQMTPCRAQPCPLYSADRPFKYALEYVSTRVAALVGSGSQLSMGGTCT